MIGLMEPVWRGLLTLDPLTREIPVVSTVHAGPTRNVPGSQPVDHPMSTVEVAMEIHRDVIRNSRVDEFTVILFEFSRKYHEHIARSMFQTVSDVSEAVGNVISAQGQPLTPDLLNDMLEKLEIDFDDTGEPIMPTAVAHPDVVKKLFAIEPTPEQLQRQKDILRRKKEAYDAKKRTRRLP